MNKALFLLVFTFAIGQKGIIPTNHIINFCLSESSKTSTNQIIYNKALNDVNNYYTNKRSKINHIKGIAILAPMSILPISSMILTENGTSTVIFTILTGSMLYNGMLNSDYQYRYNQFYDDLNTYEKELYIEYFNEILKKKRALDFIDGTIYSFLAMMIIGAIF